MTDLTTRFSEPELATVREGVRKFIRLTGLIHDPSELVWMKWFTDEGDAKAALESVATAMKATHTMVGKRKYQGQDFDAVREVTKDLNVFLTLGMDDSESALLRKRNLPLLLLVVEPTIQLFKKFSHTEMIELADEITQGVASLIDTSDAYGTYDDALVAQHQVKAIIHAREEARKAEAAAKRGKRRGRRDPLLELLAAVSEATVEDEEDAGVEELYA